MNIQIAHLLKCNPNTYYGTEVRGGRTLHKIMIIKDGKTLEEVVAHDENKVVDLFNRRGEITCVN